MSYKKMYVYFNTLSQQIDGNIFLANNDREAEYIYQVNIDKAIKNNPYFKPEDFKLWCIGVLEIDGYDTAGICYEYKDEYPVKMDDIRPGQFPKHEQPYMEKLQSGIDYEEIKEKLKEIK